MTPQMKFHAHAQCASCRAPVEASSLLHWCLMMGRGDCRVLTALLCLLALSGEPCLLCVTIRECMCVNYYCVDSYMCIVQLLFSLCMLAVYTYELSHVRLHEKVTS